MTDLTSPSQGNADARPEEIQQPACIKDGWHDWPASAPLSALVEQIRPTLCAPGLTTKAKVKLWWAAAKAARGLASPDVITAEFMRLAIESTLIDRNGRWTGTDVRDSIRRHGREDMIHCISWALRGWNPFEEGPLK